MTTEEQLAFALSQAEFWRLQYLSAKNVTDKELDFVVGRVTAAAVKEEREECAKLADHDAPWVALQIRKRGEK